LGFRTAAAAAAGARAQAVVELVKGGDEVGVVERASHMREEIIKHWKVSGDVAGMPSVAASAVHWSAPH
jgi:hypothetical protein